MFGQLASSAVTATEEARSFYQVRLAIFGLCLFVLAGGSWLILSVSYAMSAASGTPTNYRPFSESGLLHMANGLFAGVLWLATRRGTRSRAALHALDMGVMLSLTAVWGTVGATLAAPSGAFIGLLSFTTGTLARAIVVPSTALRTLVIGASGGVILVAISLGRHFGEPNAIGNVIALTCWAGSAVTLGTLASNTIFGLRREARQAHVLGQYTLEEKIGEGGMGSVWRAHHALLRRPTAIKLLPPAHMGEEAIQRFEREVQFTARLTHPNSVAIYDYGRTRDGIFYYAMEYLDGLDLEQLIAQAGPQPAERVVHLLRQVCSALAEAHDLGLVHRDVKPANVLVSPRRNEHEFAKIVDFGLVKSIDLGSADAAISGAQTITGTPLYMPPEAIRAPESVDARSDLYSLGALAWFLLVGRPPFEGKNVLDICSQHLQATPQRPSIALGRSVPSDVEDILRACLAKSADERPADARVLRGWLDDCSAADGWTAEHAADFWRTHELRAPRRTSTLASAQTMALEIADRLQESILHKQRKNPGND